MSTPTFSLAYTSVRPKFIPAVVNLWTSRAKNPANVEWVISVDSGDDASLHAAKNALATAGACCGAHLVVNDGPKTCVAGWNAAAAKTTGKVIIAVADDFNPPQNWDELLLGLEPAGWENGEYVVHVEDGYVHDILVLAILTRARYNKFGYIFYPKYQSLFCDTEFGEKAMLDSVVIQAPQLLFEHMHPDCGKRQRDQTDTAHASQERWNSGEMLFHFRRMRKFPLDDGPKSLGTDEVIAPKEEAMRFAVYLQTTKDDLCLFEVCQRMMEEGCRDFFFACPDEYWSGEPVLPEESATLQPVFDKLTALGANVNAKVFHTASYRVHPTDSRLSVETRLRNESLDWIRKQGFKHILIVDGDELWVPGTLELIRPFIQQGQLAISVRMIPVMGTPGYPVDSATDVAVVYISSAANFRVCRTPSATQFQVQIPRVIHFTSTRRTSEENEKKHRRGGHYDDPDYDFEGWMKDTLPNAKPGMVNAHMYKKYQIWPRIREWRPEEMAIIPQSIWPYLGLPK